MVHEPPQIAVHVLTGGDDRLARPAGGTLPRSGAARPLPPSSPPPSGGIARGGRLKPRTHRRRSRRDLEQELRHGPEPRHHLRHDAARRRAVAGHLAEHGREARDRPPARAARRRRHRGRLPDRLAGRLRGRPGDRPRGRTARSSPAWRAPTPPTSSAPPRRYATPSARASTPSSRRRTSTSSTSCSRRARTSRARRARRSRTRSSLVDDVEFSPMDATRADVEFTAEVHPDRDRRGRDDDQHPRHRRLRDAGRVRGVPDAALRARARPARRRALRPLPRRPRASRSPTRSPACRPARARSSARSTASASAPATRRSRRS